MKKPAVYFKGIFGGDGSAMGYIKGSDIRTNFGKTWIPEYQRERILSKSKVKALVDVWRSGKKMDAVKVNFLGTPKLVDASTSLYLLEGGFNTVDGQQRLYSFRDSGVVDRWISTELYHNLSIEEEIDMFRRYHKGTGLKFGDFIKSAQGPLADIIRYFLRNGVSDVPVTVNNGINLALVAPIMRMAHSKAVRRTRIKTFRADPATFAFIENDKIDQGHANLIKHAAENLFRAYSDVMGTYDKKAVAYKRPIFMAFMHLLVNEFLTENGSVDFRRFKAKVRSVPQILDSSYMKQEVNKSSRTTNPSIYNEFVEFLNKGRQYERLDKFEDAFVNGGRYLVEEDDEYIDESPCGKGEGTETSLAALKKS